jgi:hypothetical protein
MEKNIQATILLSNGEPQILLAWEPGFEAALVEP